jgi:hypothetical protein
MLTQRQLAKMRRVANRLLPDTATILRRTMVDDGAGGEEATYNAIGATLCRFSAVDIKTRIKDQMTAGRIQSNEGFLMSFPHDADIQETDRLAINGNTYDVISAGDKRSFEVNKRFIVKRVPEQ